MNTEGHGCPAGICLETHAALLRTEIQLKFSLIDTRHSPSSMSNEATWTFPDKVHRWAAHADLSRRISPIICCCCCAWMVTRCKWESRKSFYTTLIDNSIWQRTNKQREKHKNRIVIINIYKDTLELCKQMFTDSEVLVPTGEVIFGFGSIIFTEIIEVRRISIIFDLERDSSKDILKPWSVTFGV